MKVLHVWNTAGIGSIIAKWENKLLNWKTNVFMYKAYDPFGFTIFGELWGSEKASVNEKIVFFLKSLIKSKEYDIIHIHYHDVFIPFIKKLYRNNKLIIMHYHGSDIRNKWEKRSKYWKKADIILVSTKDLLDGSPENTVFVPNPVDVDLFYPMEKSRKKGTALFFYDRTPKLRYSLPWAINIARKMGLELTVINREINPISYKRMPYILNKYEYFIDHKYVPALSKTALEALACGLKVIRWDNKVIHGLPYKHHPRYTIKLLENTIRKAMET